MHCARARRGRSIRARRHDATGYVRTDADLRHRAQREDCLTVQDTSREQRTFEGSKIMTVAVIGAGNLGSRVARRLAEGGVDILLAAEDRGHAESIAQSIGNGVKAVEASNAVSNGDQVIFATWFATTKDLLAEYRPQLVGKIVIDPSNNMAFDGSGNASSLNPEGVSAAQQLAPLVPQGAWYVKAF